MYRTCPRADSLPPAPLQNRHEYGLGHQAALPTKEWGKGDGDLGKKKDKGDLILENKQTVLYTRLG